jgi:Leucine-rich repeat (LRR) protein
MSKERLKELLPKIENNQIIDTVELGSGFFDEEPFEEKLNDDDIILLSNALAKNSSITNVSLIAQNFGDRGATALATIKHLRKLDLWGCEVKVAGATALAKSNLEILNLRENHIVYNEENINDYELFSNMIDAFISNKTIKQLDLSSSYIPSKLIARLIAKNDTIKELSLNHCYLTDEALQDIKANKTLKALDIAENNITDEGAIYIYKSTNLEILYIDRSEITDKGAYFLSKSDSLKELTICGSGITVKGLQYFFYSNLNKINCSVNSLCY